MDGREAVYINSSNPLPVKEQTPSEESGCYDS